MNARDVYATEVANGRLPAARPLRPVNAARPAPQPSRDEARLAGEAEFLADWLERSWEFGGVTDTPAPASRTKHAWAAYWTLVAAREIFPQAPRWEGAPCSL